jgi:predicted amidohydrolase
MKIMKIGLVQASAAKDIWKNIDTIKTYVLDAKKQGCQVVCFPECFLTGYFPEEAEELAVLKNCKEINLLLDLAVSNEIDLLAGFMESEKHENYITHAVFKSNGEYEYYRKTHLGEKEALYFSEGDKLNVLNLSNGTKIGFQLCVEIHFLEITKALSLRGAEIVFAPHAVPRAAGNRKNIWGKIIPARSYDNRVYMACCNQWDEEKFGGGCMITGPNGDVIAECFDDREALLVAEIDIEKIRRYHEKDAGKRYRYYPSMERRELYE